MTTLRESPTSKLGVKLQNYRTDRPDEWTMDEFTREAETMAMRIKELERLGFDMADELQANYNNQRTRIMFMKWNKALSE